MLGTELESSVKEQVLLTAEQAVRGVLRVGKVTEKEELTFLEVTKPNKG